MTASGGRAGGQNGAPAAGVPPGVPLEQTLAGAGRGERQPAGRSTAERSPDNPVTPGLAELQPPDGVVLAPPYGYVQRLLRGREREMGASASGARAVRDSGTRQANVASRSFTDIVREIRRRRKLLVTPPIPP